jgi:hypothetical protein
MSNPIARPTFYEGEILPAADLGATVDYARNQMARHSRYQHSWGIATGLALTFSNGATLGKGVAIDGTGREIVVPDDVQLDPTTFRVYAQNPNTWYPVYLNGVDKAGAPSPNLSGACGNSLSTSMQETYQITFGSPGSELQLSQQQIPAIADGPDGGISGVWLVLVGFVQWNATPPAFTGAAGSSATSSVRPQYVGVNAAQVISGSGSLLLATDPATPAGANPVMAVEIQENPAQLIFGKMAADGTITPALTVTAGGDVTATGQISGAVTPGSMQVQSGIAFDGMILPLPTGIDPADAAAGKVTVHTHVTLRYPPPSPPRILVPAECRVDSSTRRVHCRVIDITAGLVPTNTQPGWCDYLVIVAVPASNGSGA